MVNFTISKFIIFIIYNYFRSDCAQLFREHVYEHGEDETIEQNNFICKWIVPEQTLTNSEHQHLCGRVFNRLYNLRSHLLRHTGLPNFVCSECKQCFIELSCLKEHFSWSIYDIECCLTNSVEPGTTYAFLFGKKTSLFLFYIDYF